MVEIFKGGFEKGIVWVKNLDVIGTESTYLFPEVERLTGRRTIICVFSESKTK